MLPLMSLTTLPLTLGTLSYEPHTSQVQQITHSGHPPSCVILNKGTWVDDHCGSHPITSPTKLKRMYKIWVLLLTGGQFPTIQAKSRKFVRTDRSPYYLFTFFLHFIHEINGKDLRYTHSQSNVLLFQPGLSSTLACLAQEMPSRIPLRHFHRTARMGLYSRFGRPPRPSKTTHPWKTKLCPLILLVVNYWNTHTNLPILKRKNIFLEWHIIYIDFPTHNSAW